MDIYFQISSSEIVIFIYFPLTTHLPNQDDFHTHLDVT
jgi:hypothetical protein